MSSFHLAVATTKGEVVVAVPIILWLLGVPLGLIIILLLLGVI